MKKIIIVTVAYIFIFTIAVVFWLVGLQVTQTVTQKVTGELPKKKNISMAFTAQAPEGNWVEPWQNACEETVIVMMTSYYRDEALSVNQAVTKIKDILTQKETLFGVTKDESMAQVAQLVNENNFGWTARIVKEPSLEQIKSELVANRPIIVPVYAPDLGNPYYDTQVINYHTLIISGYDDKAGEFIVQDPGTSRGHNLRFDYEVVLNAIHDLQPDNYRAGVRQVIFTTQK